MELSIQPTWNSGGYASAPVRPQASADAVPAVPPVEAMAAGAGAENGAAVDHGAPANEGLARDKATAKVMNDQFAKDCQTCKNRKYQDGSNDPGVSFKSPQSIDPSVAASVVMGHEQEHVAHEQAKAKQEGGKVVSQTVVLHGDICPECGRYYISGGTTRTVTRSGGQAAIGPQMNNSQPGEMLDAKA